MKPIEKGCKAMIVCNDHDSGKTVTVGNFIGAVEHFSRTKHWEIDAVMNLGDGCEATHIDESFLQRLDDYDGNEKASWDALEGIYTPPLEIA